MPKPKKSSALTPAAAKPLEIVVPKGGSPEQAVADLTIAPAMNAGLVIAAFTGNTMGKDAVGINEVLVSLQDSIGKVQAGDMSTAEGMLVAQATALQTIFVSYARKAQAQSQQRNLEAFMGMALKAQAQSRATLQALIELKFPKQATFVRQANIANGPQQVNNGAAAQPEPVHCARGTKTHSQQNQLLEDARNGSTYLDTGAAPAAARGNSTLAAVEQVHRPAKPRRQGDRR